MLIVLTGLCLECGFEFWAFFAQRLTHDILFGYKIGFGRLPNQIKGFLGSLARWKVSINARAGMYSLSAPPIWPGSVSALSSESFLVSKQCSTSSYHLPWGDVWLVSFAILSCSRLKIFIGLQGCIFGILWKPGRYQTLSNDMIIKWFAEITLSIIQYIPCSQGNVSYS